MQNWSAKKKGGKNFCANSGPKMTRLGGVRNHRRPQKGGEESRRGSSPGNSRLLHRGKASPPRKLNKSTRESGWESPSSPAKGSVRCRQVLLKGGFVHQGKKKLHCWKSAKKRGGKPTSPPGEKKDMNSWKTNVLYKEHGGGRVLTVTGGPSHPQGNGR